MRGVKEYLDRNFIGSDEHHDTKEKEDGHLGVFGTYVYMPTGDKYDSVTVSINNETLQLRARKNGKYVETLYGYLQTYKHLKRGEPDKNGYYKRSTDEEVIKYIQIYVDLINEL